MISLLSHNYQTHFCCFYVDSEDELKNLPTHLHGGAVENTQLCCAYGSVAKCGNGKKYVLSGDDMWVVDKSASSSGGSSSGGGSSITEDDIEPIPDEDIKNLFT